MLKFILFFLIPLDVLDAWLHFIPQIAVTFPFLPHITLIFDPLGIAFWVFVYWRYFHNKKPDHYNDPSDCGPF